MASQGTALDPQAGLCCLPVFLSSGLNLLCFFQSEPLSTGTLVLRFEAAEPVTSLKSHPKTFLELHDSIMKNLNIAKYNIQIAA